VTVDDVITIYERQVGKCAISGVKMDHCPNKLTSISIDRIDSDIGYTLNNTQLVCQFVNLGKHVKTNNDAILFLNALRTKLNEI